MILDILKFGDYRLVNQVFVQKLCDELQMFVVIFLGTLHTFYCSNFALEVLDACVGQTDFVVEFTDFRINFLELFGVLVESRGNQSQIGGIVIQRVHLVELFDESLVAVFVGQQQLLLLCYGLQKFGVQVSQQPGFDLDPFGHVLQGCHFLILEFLAEAHVQNHNRH